MRSAAAAKKETAKVYSVFKSSESTDILRRIQLNRVLRASLSFPHYSSDKAILAGLIKAGFQNTEKIPFSHRTLVVN